MVALSGGVDSAVLLALALEALGTERVIAVTATSPSIPAREIAEARSLAAELGVRHETVATREIEIPGYKANVGERCYHCRAEMFRVLRGLAQQRGFRTVAYGAIADDAGDYRPGMRAAAEGGAVAPLLAAGLRKAEVRSLAAEMGLAVSDKPASACLSSRIPVGTEVTPARLAQIDRAEAALIGMGFRQVRVRHHGDVARLELDEPGMRHLDEPGIRSRVVEAIKAAGFRFVALDLEGYRTGSLNPVSGPGRTP